MIDSTKLLSRGSVKRSPFSSKTVANIGVIREDTKKIDSILKERLVLSKVRYGIIKQQEERQRRKKREDVLEKDKDSKNYDIEKPESKKRKGFGGFLSGVFRVVMSLLGGVVVKFLPQLIIIAKTIKSIAVPFAKILGSVFSFFSLLTAGTLFKQIAKDSRNFDGSKITKSFANLEDKFLNPVSGLLTAIITFAAVTIGSNLVGGFLRKRSFSRVNVLNDARVRQVDLEEKAYGKRKDILERRQDRLVRIQQDSQITRRNKLRREQRELVEASINDSTFDVNLRKKQLQLLERQGPEEFLKRNRQIKKVFDRKVERQIKKFDYELEREFRSRDGKQLDIFKDMTVEAQERAAISDPAADAIRREIAADPEGGRISDFKPEGDAPRQPRTIKKTRRQVPITDLGDLDAPRGRVDITKILNKIGKNPKQVAKNLKAGVVTRPKKGEIEAAREIIKKFNSTISPVEQMRFNMAKGFKGMLESIGGTPLIKSTRKLLSNTVGRIPFLGDLIGLLLDIFVFGEPVGRAAFMAIGGILGGFLGAAVGSLVPGPGTLIGGILGGLGGDIVGGLLYDLIFGRKPKVTPESAVTKGTVRGVSKTVKGFDEGGLVPRFQPSKLRVDDPMDKSINLRSFAFYERSQSGKEKMIPIPIPIPQESTNQQGQMIVVNNSGKQQTNNFSQLYRRG